MNNKKKDLNSSNEWLNIARKDWLRVKRNLKDEDIESAGFFLQQSLEKYIKAYLLQAGWKLRKTHELDALLDDIVKYNSSFKSFRSLCERISGYYLAERYPPLGDLGLTSKDITDDLEKSKKFIKTLFADENIT